MAATHCYRILGETIGIRFPSDAVADTFRHALAGFESSHTSPGAHPYEIQTGRRPGTFSSRIKVCTPTEYSSLFELVAGMERTVLSAAYSHMDAPGVHAGAVTRNGLTILIPGNPGSGKTSLVLGLLLNGWTLLSDEIAPVDTKTSQIGPFPRALWIKPGGMDVVVGVDSKGLLGKPEVARRIGGVHCVTPTAFPVAADGETSSVTSVVFPSVDRNLEARIDSVPRSEALGRLMDLTFNRDRFPGGGMDLLGDLVAGADCYTLTSGSLRHSVDLVLEACG